MKGGAVVSVWHMVIIAGASTHDHDVFSMKDSLLVFQAFICCEWLLGRNLLYVYYVSPTLAAGLGTSGATPDSVIFIIPTECMSMTEGDLFFSPTAFIISHHLLKMRQTFAFGNPPLLSELLLFFASFLSTCCNWHQAKGWNEEAAHHTLRTFSSHTLETHVFVNAGVCQPDKLECLNRWWACWCPAASGNRNLALKSAAKQKRENGSVVLVYVVGGQITSWRTPPQLRVLGSAGRHRSSVELIFLSSQQSYSWRKWSLTPTWWPWTSPPCGTSVLLLKRVSNPWRKVFLFLPSDPSGASFFPLVQTQIQLKVRLR